MKKNGILNSDISRVLSYMGHTDRICIGDCGLPVPDSTERIDLALKFGQPSFMDVLKDGFPPFLAGMANPQKDEYLLPVIADGMLKAGVPFSVLPTDDQWFGVTYKEDKASVTASFRALIEQGVYQPDLYGDLGKNKAIGNR